MKKLPVSFALLSLTMIFSSCSLVEGIFKAGVWVGVLIVVVVIALVVWLFSRGSGK